MDQSFNFMRGSTFSGGGGGGGGGGGYPNLTFLLS